MKLILHRALYLHDLMTRKLTINWKRDTMPLDALFTSKPTENLIKIKGEGKGSK